MSNGRLSRQLILDAAMELLDERGAEGLTLRGLARRLGVTPMALYRHFDGKQELISAILDRATAEIALPPADLGPRDTLAALAREIRRSVLRHAPLAPELLLHPSLGPSTHRLGERGNAALEQAGLAGEDVWRGWNVIAMYALGFAIVEAPRAWKQAADEDSTLTSRLSPPPPAELFSEAQFEHGLQCVLSGVLDPHAVEKDPSSH